MIGQMAMSIRPGGMPLMTQQRSSLRAAPRLNRTVMMAERPRQDDNPADKLGAAVEDKLEGFVEATKENSGLGANLKQQPGNKNPGKGSIVDESGQAGEAMAPGGLVPEVTNGRAAMLGMLAAFGAELATKEPIAAQAQKAPLLIAATFVTIIIASVIPVFRGADLNQKGAGPFTPRAEIWNGRVAMVAFATLLVVETFKAGPGLVPGGGPPSI